MASKSRNISITITGDARGVRQAMSQANSALGGMQTGIKKLMGLAGLGGLTLALQRGGEAAVGMALEFETSLAKIVGLVGASREQVQAWGDDILDMAPRVAKSPQELADTLFFVASAGVEAGKEMEVLEAAAKASAAGLGDMSLIADVATSAMNAYGAENLSAAEAVDVLIGAVQDGKAEPEDMAGSFGRVIPIAAEMGVEFHEVAAAVAAMSNVGLDASESVTALRGVMSALLKPTKEAEDVLAEYGLSSAELRRQLREEGLLATLVSLKDTFGENETALAAVFGNVRALTGVLNLVGANLSTTEAIFQSMSDTTGKLDEAFGVVAETSGFKLQQALTELQVIGTEVGADMLPGIVSAVQAFIPALRELLPEVGAAAVALLDMANNVLPPLIWTVKQVASATRGLTFIFDGLADAVGLSDGRSADMARNMQYLESALADGVQPAAAFANAVRDMAATGEVTEAQVRMLAAAAGLSEEEMEAARKALVGYAEDSAAAEERFAAMTEVARRFTDEGIRPTREEVEALGVVVEDGADPWWALQQAMRAFNENGLDTNVTVQEINDAFGHSDRVSQAYSDRLQGLADHMADTGDSSRDMGDAVIDAGDDMDEAAGEARTLAEKLREAADAQESLTSAVKAAVDPVFNLIDKTQRYSELLEEVDKDGKRTAEEQLELAQAALDVGAALDEVDAGNFEDAITVMAEVLGVSRDEAANLLNELGIFKDDAGEIGVGIKDGILQGAAGLGSRLASQLNRDISDAITQTKGRFDIKSPSGVFADEVGKPITEGIAEGILKAKDKAKSAVQEVMEDLRQEAEEGLDNVFSAINATLSAFDAAQSLKDAEEEVAELRAELDSIPGAIAETEAALMKARAAARMVTAEEQVAIERAQDNLKRTRERFEAGEASAAEVKVAEQQLAEARREATGPTREVEELEEQLAELRERRRELPREIADAEDALTQAQLRQVKAQHDLIEAGAEMANWEKARLDAFIALAEQAGLTADAIAVLVSAADQAAQQAGRFEGPALDAKGGKPSDVMKMTDAQLREAITREFTRRGLSAPSEDRLKRLVSEARGGRSIASIGKALDAWMRSQGLEIPDAQLREAIIREFTSRDLPPPSEDRLKRLVSEVRGGRSIADIGKALDDWKRSQGLASGGIAVGETIRPIGEKGPEAVIPLNGRGVGILADALAQAMERMGGGVRQGPPVKIYVTQPLADPVAAARELAWRLKTAGV